MRSNIKLYAGIALTAVIGVLFAMLRIKSAKLEKAKSDLDRERLHKKAAQEAAETIKRSNGVLQDAIKASESARSMSDSDARAELRKYARD